MSVIGNTSLAFSEEQAMLLDVAREFCRDRSPIEVVREQLETETGFDPALWQEMVDLGWAGIALPEAYGGAGLDIASVVPVVESMGRAMLGTPLISSTLAAQLILRAGNSEQKERLLPPIAAGTPATVGLLEQGDWGASAPACTLDANGLLGGSKQMVCDAGVAQCFVVSVMGTEGPALAVLGADQVAASRQEHVLIDQTRRAATIDLNGLTVTPENILSGPAVETALRDVYLLGALLIAAEATGR